MAFKTNKKAQTIQTRLTRQVFVVILTAFVIFGLIAMFAIRTSARDALSQDHAGHLAEISRAVSNDLNAVREDVRRLANDSATRNFAGQTVTVASNTLQSAQERMLGEFISLMQQNPNYLEIRYITRSGSVWTKVSGYNGISTDTSVYLNQFTSDEALVNSLRLESGGVVLGPLVFQTDETGRPVNPIRPLFRFSAPVAAPNDSTNVAGVVQIDVAAESTLSLVNTPQIFEQGTPANRRLYLVNNLGQILADSLTPANTYPARGVASESSSFSIQQADIDQLIRSTVNDFSVTESSGLVFSTAQISLPDSMTMPWRLLVVDTGVTALGQRDLLAMGVLLLTVATGFGLSVFTVRRLNRIVRPLDKATALAKELGGTEAPKRLVAVDVDLSGKEAASDEVEQLIRAFQTLSNRVVNLTVDLENETARHTRNLQIAARISRETATLYDTDKLLNRAIDLIVEEFDFYHAQVFLVDEIGQNAVLFYSYGEIGQRMLAQRHKIAVGSESVIGQVTQRARPLIVNDTEAKDTPHRFNPLLPETRAEMAIPLQIGSNVIGALDIQSNRAQAFRPEDVETFQLLADQIAIAIHNARLLMQSEERVEQIDKLNRQLTRRAWEDVEDREGLETTYNYDLFNVSEGDTTADIEIKQNLTAEITIRGQVIGSLEASPPEGMEFTDGDQVILRAVADRVALAIENARLFQETQSSLAQTSVLYQISRYLNEADTLEDIVQAIIVSVMPDAISGQVGVFDEFSLGESPEWMEINADWSMVERADRDISLPGVQLHVPDHPLLSAMQSNQVTLVKDTERDERIDVVLQDIYQDIGARSVVFIPFSVRGNWRGLIMIEFPEPRDFSEREGRIYSTLIDQVGVAIDNRLLLRQTEMALSQIERLYAASRIINTAQTLSDLVRAALTTTADETLNFELGIFEGALDSTGWPTRMRVVAHSFKGDVVADNLVHEVQISAESPLRYRETQIIIDRTPEDEDVSPMVRFIRLRNNRFGAAFPLFSANQPIALFFITSPMPRELSSEDYEVYRALTGQMSTVLQNRRLLEQTEQFLDETRRLYTASRAITVAQDSMEVYQAAAEHLSGASELVHRIVVLLAGPAPSPDAPYLDYAFVWTRDGEDVKRELRLSNDILRIGELTVEAGGTVLFNDIDEQITDHPALYGLFQSVGARSVILAPVQSGNKWLGVLACESDEPGVFDEQFVRFTQAISDQVAIAVDNRQLFEEAQLQAQQALALAEAGQLANRIGGSFEESIGEVFARVAEPAGYDRWLLMLLDDSRSNLEQVSQHLPGLDPSETISFNMNTTEHSIVDAVRYNRMIVINEPTLYPAFNDYSAAHLELVGKHIVTPIRIGNTVVGALLIGRNPDAIDLDDRDEQLVSTLAAQVAVAVENRRLFLTAEGERQTLRSTLETLPAGVLVLDSRTYKPLQFNDQIEALLGRPINVDTPFSVSEYSIYRTNTSVYYPQEELPIFAVRDRSLQVDDVIIIHDDGSETALLVNAAPIFDKRGGVNAIVAAFTDISNLRSLENTLQDNLRDTIALYEATRSIAEADTQIDVLDIVIMQIASLMPSSGYILLLDDLYGVKVARSIDGMTEVFPLPDDVLNRNHNLIIHDINQYEALDEKTRMDLQALDVAALVSMPLRARSRRDVPLGWMVLTFDEVRQLTPEQERFLSTLNDSASIALDNRQLLKSTEVALSDTEALYDATTSISRARDINELGEALHASLERIHPDLFAGFFITNDIGDASLVEIFNVAMDAQPADFRSLIRQHGRLVTRNIYIDDLRLRQNPNALEQDLLKMGNIRSFALVNLSVKGTFKGHLIIAYHQPHKFSESETRYLGTVVDSASVVLDNILLFGQIQSNLDETSILYQASRALSDANTPENILDVVVQHMIDGGISIVFLAVLHGQDWTSPSAYVQIVSSWQRESSNDLGLTGVTLTSEQFPAWRQLSSTDILMVENIEEEESMSPLERMGIESLDIRALAVIPLRSGGQAIGAIMLGSQTPRRFTERDLRIYQSFSEQASLKLEASRLLRQTQRRARQLATSAQVSSVASTILDLNVLLPQLVDLIRESFGYDHTQIFLMDGEQRYAELRASTGEAGRQLLSIRHRLEKGSASVIGQVTSKGEPAIALDTADASVVHRPNPYLPNTRSEMAVPLIVKGVVAGALDVQSNQPNAFDEDDVAVLTTLAAQISVAIDNARLFDEARRRAAEMSFLFGVTTAAASSDSLNTALQNVAVELRDSLHALSVSIYLPENLAEEEDEEPYLVLRPVALAGTTQPISELSEVDVEEDVDNTISVIARTRQPLIISNVENEKGYLPISALAQSAIIVPLTSGSQLIGLITMESDTPNAYDNETRTLLLTLSGTLSAIVQNQQLLEQVQQTNEQLRTLDRLKSDFLANMSHELRTPLNSIIGFSRVILKGIDGPLTEMQEQDLTTIYNSGQHLLNLINDILDQAKISANKMDLQFDYFEIKSVIDGVRSIGIGLVKDKPIDIFVEMGPGLPKAYGDEFRTRQVLLNLVSNATKFTREGSVTLTVYTVQDAETGKTMIRIDVTDTGIGIAEKDLPLLFEAFRQVDSSLTRTVGGTGLGLPIAKSLIEMQGGEMLVSSEVNKGSTFSVTIPIEPTMDVEGEEQPEKTRKNTGKLKNTSKLSPPPSNGGSAQPEPEPKKSNTLETQETMMRPPMMLKRQILIIEENPDMVDQFRRAIQREGFDVFAASIPLEAEAMASGLHPTIIIMDINFANGAGWSIIKKLKGRDDTCDIPVIVVSLSEEVDKIMEAGAFRFIRRPFMPETLVEAVKDAERESRIDRILIIDDQPESVRLIEQLLKEQGQYRVFSAQSGPDGIALVARRRPDLIVLDLRMPEMDGFAVVEELRANPETANIPVLVVTSDTLNPTEIERLSHLQVMYKSDISREAYNQFLNGVKTHLKVNGD